MMKYLLFVMLSMVCACSAPGTGTGNPIGTSIPGGAPANPGSGIGSGGSSGEIFLETCAILQRCNPGMTDTTCANGIFGLTGFAPKLGLTVTPAPSAEQIVLLEANHQITADSVQADKCLAQMMKLSCGDSVIQGAYVASAVVPFAGAPEMLDPVCAGTFGP